MFKVQYLFFIIGIIFLFATIVYFSYNYLYSLSNSVKAIILGCLTLAAFFAGDYLREKDI